MVPGIVERSTSARSILTSNQMRFGPNHQTTTQTHDETLIHVSHSSCATWPPCIDM